MKDKKSFKLQNIILLSLLGLIFSVGVYAEVEKGSASKNLYKTNEANEFFVFNINNLFLPVDNKGVIADVDPGSGPGGRLGGESGIVFLFSSGFYLSGYTDRNADGRLQNNEMWGNGVLSASRIEDYQPGPVGSNRGDSKNLVYSVLASEPPFGDSWEEWKDAVSLGADFYDGDGDGVYNPVDKNGNNKWDENEDRPDLIGDATAWTVYNDGVPAALRRYTVEPQGVEIHQSVFGFQINSGAVGNMMFVRYRLKNTGTVADTFYNCYFSAAADPDLGDPNDDLVGCDIDLSAGYVYAGGSDSEFGSDPPSFLMDFFQGPIVYEPGVSFTDDNGNGVYDDGIDTPLDTAFNVKGRQLGITEIPGAMNKPLTAMTQYMQSHPSHGDPNTHFELRNYLIGGKGKNGDSVYVSSWEFGNGATLSDTSNIVTRYMYSGDPVTGTGWLNTEPIDQRQMSNTGPFTLVVGEPQDIIVAYVVGRADTGPNSVDQAKENSVLAQLIFDSNFPSPPPPPPIPYTLRMNEEYIELDFQTSDNVLYNAIDTVFQIDRKTQGFFINAYRTNSTQESINGIQNKKQIAAFRMDNFIDRIFGLAPNGGTDLFRKKDADSLDPVIYGDPATGRIRVRITEDPFEAGRPLIKGSEYFFQLGSYTLNHLPIVPRTADSSYGAKDDYYDPSGGAYREWPRSLIRTVFGSDFYTPSVGDSEAELASGVSDGGFKYLVVDKDQLTGNNYSVEFFKDVDSELYSTYWKLTNESTGSVLIDSSKQYDFDSKDISGNVIDGFIPKVKPVTAGLISQAQIRADYQSVNETWIRNFSRDSVAGVYYVGNDMSSTAPESGVPALGFLNIKSDKISVTDLKRVELRFGGSNKAYRYLNGFVGRNIFAKRKSFAYAGGVTADDTTNTGMQKFGEGFVDVPFSAWVVDERLGEEYQLATAFVEVSELLGGTPDGVWDPTFDLNVSKEVIIIFNSPYDPNGGNTVYTGGTFGSETVVADIIQGYDIPGGAAGITEEQRELADNPFFDGLYVACLPRDNFNPSAYYADGDILPIEVAAYPYTENDKFEFVTSASGALSESTKKEIFNKINVFPNPLFAHNPATGYDISTAPDDAFVTFSNLPEEVTIKIYSLSGILLRILRTEDKEFSGSTFLRWDLKNESELRVASGMYIALVESPGYGQKILKFALVMPQKQLQRF